MKTKQTIKQESTSLTVIKPKALKAPPIVPKPSKADIINAAVERASQLHKESLDEYEKFSDAIHKKMLKRAQVILDKGINIESHGGKVTIQGWGKERDKLTLELSLGDDPDIRMWLREHAKLKTPGYFCERTEREKVKQALDGAQDRVAIILANDENVKLLDDLLKKVNLKKE